MTNKIRDLHTIYKLNHVRETDQLELMKLRRFARNAQQDIITCWHRFVSKETQLEAWDKEVLTHWAYENLGPNEPTLFEKAVSKINKVVDFMYLFNNYFLEDEATWTEYIGVLAEKEWLLQEILEAIEQDNPKYQEMIDDFAQELLLHQNPKVVATLNTKTAS